MAALALFDKAGEGERAEKSMRPKPSERGPDGVVSIVRVRRLVARGVPRSAGLCMGICGEVAVDGGRMGAS